MAAERDALYAKDYDRAAVRDLGSRLFRFCNDRHLPRPLRLALGRCLTRAWCGTPALREVLVEILEAAERGDHDLRTVAVRYGFVEEGRWAPPADSQWDSRSWHRSSF